MSFIIKRLLIIFLMIPLLMGTTTTTKPSVFKFHKGNLTTAKQQAAREGKLYLVDFVAKWCMPCRWMEETTFADPAVKAYLDQNYVAVKIDIDDFDGFAYKQLYDIKILPSILIFNSNGQIVDQYQESLSPSRMLKILKQNNTAANRPQVASIQDAPATTYNTPQKPAVQNKPNRPASTPQKPKVEKPVRTQPARSKVKPSAATPAPQRPSHKPNVSAPVKPTKTKPVYADEGLYRFKVSRQASQGFSVQIGAFGEYGNVLREVAILEDKYSEPIIVHIAKWKGKPIYKILLGEFNDRMQAEQFKSYVVQNGIQAITKDLSQL